jgi:HPt (histidine-containing phosphotransfer) domain-containing protein
MTELDIRLPAIRRAAANGESATLMFEAHSLKGSSQQMGAIKLSALCLRMEISGRGNTIVDEGLLAEAEREALRVRKALQAAARI